MNPDRRGDYGVDAPHVPVAFVLTRFCCLALGAAFFAWSLPRLGALAFAAAILLAVSTSKAVPRGFGVSETLLIPLHYRVLESRSEASPFKDAEAERFHDAIAYNWEKFLGGQVQQSAMAARFRVLDREVGAFLAANPDGLVVNLGAGLDTRFHRLDNGSVAWVEIDLPDVIAFRRKLGEPSEPRHVLLAASVLEEGWVTEVVRRARPRILFIAEGLFPYFTEAEHRAVFARLVENFPGQQILFQTFAPSVLPAFASMSDFNRLRMNAEMRWELEEGADVAALNSKAAFVAELPLLEGVEHVVPEAARGKSRRSPSTATGARRR